MHWNVGKKVYREYLCEQSGRKDIHFMTDVNMFTVNFKLGYGDNGGFKLSYRSCKYMYHFALLMMHLIPHFFMNLDIDLDIII